MNVTINQVDSLKRDSSNSARAMTHTDTLHNWIHNISRYVLQHDRSHLFIHLKQELRCRPHLYSCVCWRQASDLCSSVIVHIRLEATSVNSSHVSITLTSPKDCSTMTCYVSTEMAQYKNNVFAKWGQILIELQASQIKIFNLIYRCSLFFLLKNSP